MNCKVKNINKHLSIDENFDVKTTDEKAKAIKYLKSIKKL